MNPYSGHLIADMQDEDRKKGYERIPAELELFARLKLAGRPEAQVNLRGSTPLAQWAKKKRKDPDAEPTAADLHRMTLIDRELREFAERLKKRVHGVAH